eukprot:CAMPEP_0196601042 /NCGR_PEP_ID=MMETSP1081-20130531/95702_1 /TAXON_ID=36882 /ORGANISM="Pyramimonas amylifera, Strain CCMP720" /LENGTH=140 /DNA_ID=CAMNT_0041926903 /DNA_START=654 /DNA_END=1076 /DNA_ORIENTATION=+
MQSDANVAGIEVAINTYIGWPGSNVSVYSKLVKNTDSVYLHAYRTTPDDAYGYTASRLESLRDAIVAEGKNYEVNVIFSSESEFMGPWLENNELSIAETMYYTDAYDGGLFEDCTSLIGMHLGDFTYFAYTYLNSKGKKL